MVGNRLLVNHIRDYETENLRFNHFTQEALKAPPKTMIEKSQALWTQLETEGYKQGAIAALRRVGYRAWENQVGDISVLPPIGSLDAIN